MEDMPGCSVKYSPVCIMHTCLRQPMRLCRWAGVFPVEGLNKRTCSELKFNLNSAYTVYLYLSLLGQFLLTSLTAYHFIIHDLSLTHLKNLVFYTTSTVTALFLVKLAANWPTLIKRAWYIESRVVHIRIGNTRPENYTRIAYMVLILSLVEHLLSIFFKIKIIMTCRQDESMNLHLLEQLSISQAKFVFEITSFSHWKAMLFEVVNIQSTFLWNFTDAMTMCVSLYLTSYFRDLNKLIEQQQSLKNIRWEEMRLYYSDLVQLVQTVDSKTCYLILLSFFTNVFFICTQLFSLLRSNNSVVVDCHHENILISIEGVHCYIIYYCYSSIFLFVRATITSLLAANVNTIAQKPFHIIQHVPTSEYTIEVQRFIRQTRHTTTALSGVFFDVTRGMILTVIGTIVKYELVLLQFSVKTYEAIH